MISISVTFKFTTDLYAFTFLGLQYSPECLRTSKLIMSAENFSPTVLASFGVLTFLILINMILKYH